MFRRNVLVLINSKHDRDVLVLGGSGNDHFLNGATEVLFGVFGPGKHAG